MSRSGRRPAPAWLTTAGTPRFRRPRARPGRTRRSSSASPPTRRARSSSPRGPPEGLRGRRGWRRGRGVRSSPCLRVLCRPRGPVRLVRHDRRGGGRGSARFVLRPCPDDAETDRLRPSGKRDQHPSSPASLGRSWFRWATSTTLKTADVQAFPFRVHALCASRVYCVHG